jgi:uncharacterized glyoxalase superfamily protein PhnB
LPFQISLRRSTAWRLIYRRAKTAGAEIVIDIEDEGRGGRGFSRRDPEGHLWNIDTHDPWQAARA